MRGGIRTLRPPASATTVSRPPRSSVSSLPRGIIGALGADDRSRNARLSFTACLSLLAAQSLCWSFCAPSSSLKNHPLSELRVRVLFSELRMRKPSYHHKGAQQKATYARRGGA